MTEHTRDCPLNGTVTLHFISNVANGYFSKDVGLGEREVSPESMVVSRHYQNGRDTVVVKPSKSNAQLTVGQEIPFNIKKFPAIEVNNSVK